MKFLKRFAVALALAVVIVISIHYFMMEFTVIETTLFVFSIVSLAMLIERILEREERP